MHGPLVRRGIIGCGKPHAHEWFALVECVVARRQAQHGAALLADLVKAKPSTSKGIFLQKVSLSSTMGIGIAVDQSSLSL